MKEYDEILSKISDTEKPYSEEDYEKAKQQGYDLDDWNDYVDFYGLGEREEYE